MAFQMLITSFLLAAAYVIQTEASAPHPPPPPPPPPPSSYAPSTPPPPPPPPPYHPAARPSYHPRPPYKPAPYQPRPYHPRPYHPQPSYGHAPGEPECAKNTTKDWCLEDSDYPLYELKHAITEHKYKFLELYADVADLNTDNSVDRLKKLVEETYLCPSETAYIRPLRAKNTDDKWRVIINNIKVDYDEFTQTVRIEECSTYGEACPLVPACYESSCLQKSIYHRFVVYDPYDSYFPFAIETFKLPASCACFVGAYDFSSSH